MNPSVGRIVHFVPPNVEPADAAAEVRAAIVTDVLSASTGLVGLAVFMPYGIAVPPEVAHADTPTPGCWSWPPRV
ncbi:hypothetical protein SEA_CHRIS_3 [Mycobacterium phage Chris]|uniref:Uncharacterized protein n=1 Tax=Mycobacterium phage Chris TaxID=2725626 RepID=A0A6M3SWP9_9CAUD|nr:hypothetical protein I5G96_gp003 [Mycobacterium phage Chris]QJD50406.1 hypothetical protein SEA_CHRIS_3 [Mycobacterium phage Chris]